MLLLLGRHDRFSSSDEAWYEAGGAIESMVPSAKPRAQLVSETDVLLTVQERLDRYAVLTMDYTMLDCCDPKLLVAKVQCKLKQATSSVARL